MSEGTANERCRGNDDPAERIRLVYILAYRDFRERQTGVPCDYGCKPIPVWDGGRAARGESRKPIWYALSDFARWYNFGPEGLVHATFGHFLDLGAQDPPDLMSAESVGRTERSLTGNRRKAERAIALQNNTFTTQVVIRREIFKETPEQAGLRVLNDPTVELSALYRYGLAVKAELTEVSARFVERGVVQYLRMPDAYDSAWAGVLPPGLTAAAEDYYRRSGG